MAAIKTTDFMYIISNCSIYAYHGAIALSYPPPFFIDDSGAEFHAD